MPGVTVYTLWLQPLPSSPRLTPCFGLSCVTPPRSSSCRTSTRSRPPPCRRVDAGRAAPERDRRVDLAEVGGIDRTSARSLKAQVSGVGLPWACIVEPRVVDHRAGLRRAADLDGRADRQRTRVATVGLRRAAGAGAVGRLTGASVLGNHACGARSPYVRFRGTVRTGRHAESTAGRLFVSEMSAQALVVVLDSSFVLCSDSATGQRLDS